jgi:hypothetical protein
MSRRQFLKYFGLAAGTVTLSPLIINKLEKSFAQVQPLKVYLIKNGDCFQNISKLFEMIDISAYVSPTDVVILKGNAQWPYQGYTHTGVIKAIADKILSIPNFSGEILICDNTQVYGSSGNFGFDVPIEKRARNWPDHNWNSLAQEYQNQGKPVAAKVWLNSVNSISGPGDGEGWIRSYFSYQGRNTYLSYPIFESPLTPGRMIDMKKGVWENGSYTGRKVKAIFIPTLNNHGEGEEDYAGITSAIKSFFGATEIHGGGSGSYQNHFNIHASSYEIDRADYAGELVARFINTQYSPVLYVTAAIWSGHHSRMGDATETKTIIACENPATLDYIACKEVISPYAPFLNPDFNNNTRKQILGCIAGGVGTIDPVQFEVIRYDFNNPSINRTDIDKKIRDFKEGKTTEQEVKEMINQYMEDSSRVKNK